MDRAVLTALVRPRTGALTWDRDRPEMLRLAHTAGIEIVESMYQARPRPHPAHYFGSGFVDEIAQTAEGLSAEWVIVNGNLSPNQGAGLEQRLQRGVLDRTQLILEIFAQRAQSSEGKIQVELASLRYMLPRLTGQGHSMSRLAGGIGTRGPGETKLEVDRRRTRERIRELEDRIGSLKAHRQQLRRGRRDLVTVSLVGYTNAGKSTLLNCLAGTAVLAEDALFATLDPKLASVDLPSGTRCLFADTVGFIRHLPHDLIAAFRATLEEVALSDVLVHVVDASHDDAEGQMEVVSSVISELDAGHVPVVTAFNKIDQTQHRVPARLWDLAERPVAVAASMAHGMDELLRAVDACLANRRRRVRLLIPHHLPSLLAQIHQDGRVLQLQYTEEGVTIEAELSKVSAERIEVALQEAKRGSNEGGEDRDG